MPIFCLSPKIYSSLNIVKVNSTKYDKKVELISILLLKILKNNNLIYCIFFLFLSFIKIFFIIFVINSNNTFFSSLSLSFLILSNKLLA